MASSTLVAIPRRTRPLNVMPLSAMSFSAMSWFVKLEQGQVDKARFDAVVPEHLAWVAELRAAGHRAVTGYWADRQGREGAGGMLLFQARDLAEAEAIVRRDPLVRHGCVRWQLHEWRVVSGEPFSCETATPDRN